MKRYFLPALLIALSLTSLSARADDWGCEVLLCLSDPRGPTTESECRPPIEKLYDVLKRGGSFPSCSFAGSAESGGSWASLGMIDTGEYCEGSTGGDADMGFSGSKATRGIQIFIDGALYLNFYLPSKAGGFSHCDSSKTPTINVPPPPSPWFGSNN